MAVAVKVPPMGESVSEVEVGAWAKAVGDFVRKDETVVSVESDKASMEVPAPASGKLARIARRSGEKAGIGDLLAEIEEGDVPAGSAQQAEKRPSLAPKAAPSLASESARLMPSAARALAESGVAPASVVATGPGGRVTKEDVLAAASAPAKSASPAPPPAAVAAPAPAAPPTVRPAAPSAARAVDESGREEEVVPMTRLRRMIAQRLVEAQHNAALLTTFNECDMTEVMRLRKLHKEAFEARYKVKLGFMSFFVKAAVEALKACPALNAEVRGTDVVYKGYYDIGVAVGGGKGLVVPVIRNADRLSFAQIEAAIADFGKRAQDGTLKPEELTGGTFTISNGGVYGSLLSTPIVNPPQSGVLGLHAIQERPVARDGQVVIRPMMYLAMSYDHRILDGREAVTSLKKMKDLIEDPARLLLEV